MQVFIIEIEFFEGINIGQKWKFINLNLFQVIELYDSLPLRIIRESNMFINLIEKNSKRIKISDFFNNL